nr:unnamed protein product [Callosobruchus analis]
MKTGRAQSLPLYLYERTGDEVGNKKYEKFFEGSSNKRQNGAWSTRFIYLIAKLNIQGSYRAPNGVFQTTKISKLLLLMEKAVDCRGKSIKDIDIDL